MVALRGKINAKTWQPLSRNVAVNDKIVKNGMSLLNLDDNDSVRITKIENKEITWRRAHLIDSPYLHTTEVSICSINWDLLSNCVIDFGNNLEIKRKEFFDFPQATPLQNIKYDNLCAHSGSIMEEIQLVLLGYDEKGGTKISTWIFILSLTSFFITSNYFLFS